MNRQEQSETAYHSATILTDVRFDITLRVLAGVEVLDVPLTLLLVVRFTIFCTELSGYWTPFYSFHVSLALERNLKK